MVDQSLGHEAGRGIATAVFLGFSSLVSWPAAAQALEPQTGTATATPSKLSDIVVNGRGDVLIGVADSATEGTVGAKELASRPIARPGEVLETIPGVIITQHSGGGKANQYYLRGFNLDHGTDIATYVDGVPVNMPTHAHGQGYTDVNWLIPEIIKGLDFKKGPYYASYGDFANAGVAEIKLADALPRNFVELQAGSLGYQRALIAASPQLGSGHLLYAVEGTHSDGPWQVKSQYRKVNGVTKWSDGNEAQGYSVAFQAYHGIWNANDPLPARALDSGAVGRFGTLDPTTGGETERNTLYGEWHKKTDQFADDVTIYAGRYYLSLFSDFTYAVHDQDRGDQLQQRDSRIFTGGRASHTVYGKIAGADTSSLLGVSVRQDKIHMTLNRTTERHFVDQVRKNDVTELNAAPYLENKTQWTPWFRTILGARADLFTFKVSDNAVAANAGTKEANAVSPKISLIFGPWAKNEVYIQGGYGVRSNDARGIVATRNPENTQDAKPLSPIVRSRGAETGIRSNALPGLNTTLSVWTLQSDSELFFTGDSGAVEDSGRPGRRYGVEWTNFYTPLPWIMIDADVAFSRARYTDRKPDVGNTIPEAIDTMAAAGINVQKVEALPGLSAGLRWRYFGPRYLIEDQSQKSAVSSVFNAQSCYVINNNLTASIEVLNLWNTRYNDAEYYYSSRLKGEAAGASEDGGTMDHMIHAGEPRSVRAGITGYF